MSNERQRRNNSSFGIRSVRPRAIPPCPKFEKKRVAMGCSCPLTQKCAKVPHRNSKTRWRRKTASECFNFFPRYFVRVENFQAALRPLPSCGWVEHPRPPYALAVVGMYVSQCRCEDWCILGRGQKKDRKLGKRLNIFLHLQIGLLGRKYGRQVK